MKELSRFLRDQWKGISIDDDRLNSIKFDAIQLAN